MGHVEYCLEVRSKSPATFAASSGTKRQALDPAERLKYEALIEQLGRQIPALVKEISRLESILKDRRKVKGNMTVNVAGREIKVSNREVTSDRIREYKRLLQDLELKMSNAVTKLRIHE